ncbi:MAG: phosphotransferase, partial [Deltaproteobacteria bacterium]|nr:phosphotransferase [Deltaproteobacteria bacterium]
THLQRICEIENDPKRIVIWYQLVIDLLMTFFFQGLMGFNTKWAYQTPEYDSRMVINECRYFESAFVQGFWGQEKIPGSLTAAYAHLAEQASTDTHIGLMHRDFQSRNIMIKNDQTYIIDFQGARKGPFQYDLASLLIDPYVKLPEASQAQLLNYATACFCDQFDEDANVFRRTYAYCSIARNLHILGAFGFLSRIKGKKKFERYVPHAIETLEKNLKQLNDPILAELTHFVENMHNDFKGDGNGTD